MGKLIAGGGLNIKASTLLETMVASIIFLLVFAISLESLTRLTSSGQDAGILIEVDYRLKECFREYSSPQYVKGEYERSYDWGNIQIGITPYMDYKELRLISLKAVVSNSYKIVEFHHIVEYKDE